MSMRARTMLVILSIHLSGAVILAFDQCGYLECQTCTGTGYLMFRADDGLTYQLTGLAQVARGLHRVRVTGNLNSGCSVTCPPAAGCIGTPVVTACHATQVRFDTTGDFKKGEFINLNTSVADQLQINTWTQTKTADPPVLPYLWVACSLRHTVVRIATSDHYSPADGRCVVTGEILGEYRTAPIGCGSHAGYSSDPSRTTVDFDGNVWVANRSDEIVGSGRQGHFAKIGSGIAYQWVDRNSNGVLDSSVGLFDIFPWTNNDSLCTSTDTSTAQDELIILYQPVPGNSLQMGTRTMAVDRNGDVWVGGWINHWHELRDGQTGALKTSIGDQTCGGYGGIVDCNGVLWSARGDENANNNRLLRYDPVLQTSQCLSVFDSYGLGVDLNGFIWNSRAGSDMVAKVHPSGTPIVDTLLLQRRLVMIHPACTRANLRC